MTQDRLPAIAGTIGAIPTMIPVTVQVGPGQQSRAHVVQNRRLTPSLLASVVHQAARRRTQHQSGGTVVLKGRIETTHGTLNLDEWIAHPDHPDLAARVAGSIAFLVGLLQDNPIGVVQVKRVDATVQRLPDTHLSELRRMDLLHAHPRAGQNLDVRLAWRRYQKGLINENAQLKVPAGLSPGAARLVFAAGAEIDNLERRCGDGLPPTEVKELVPWLNARASNRQRGLFLVRTMDTQSQGSRRALSDAWSSRLPHRNRDAQTGYCLIVAKQMLSDAPGPTRGFMSTSVQIQGAHR